MTCRSCGHENRPSARFCAMCGESLAAERACPSCGMPNAADARFCDACGTALRESAAPHRTGPDPLEYTPDHLAEKIRAHAPSLEGERKQVTVLFADVSGSMDLAEQTDPEAWRAVMDRFFALLCEGVHRFEGTVVQFTGDGIMALFGAPIAHEDHAARAAYAALHLSRELSEYAGELRREQGLNFSVRMGINSGEVVVGAIGEDLRVDYTAIGHTVGLAQRMESLAEPGRAYLTEHTAALLSGFFDLRDLGRFEVKGVREPVSVSELVGVGSARSRLDLSAARGFSRFVGRQRELDLLDAALERALAGCGAVVGIVGEPGVGKSRLSHEFVERCRARGLTVYRASGAAHARNVPFHAALEMVRDYFGVGDGDPPQLARERIAGRMLLLDPGFADELPLIFDFLGVSDPERPVPRMDPDARQRRLLEAVRQLVGAHAKRELGVNLIDDLHWVDGGSLVLLEALVEAAADQRTLVVVNFRPEFRAQWMSAPHYVEIPVVPLGAEALDELLRDLVGSDPSVVELNEQIRQRTGGNPFFTEELVRALVEDGSLEGTRGAYRLTRPLASVAVPPTVHAVLAARIDRLGARDKSLLQAAAVLGKEFGEPVLERVAAVSGPALAGALRALVSAEFLFERALYPEAEYAFKHPLTQEVAYTSQLAERRRQVHGAVAEAIVELYPDRLEERAALLAHHWEAAGDTLEALRWHARAGQWAGLNDPAQAMAHWRKVRELSGSVPETAETLGLGVLARIWILQFAWRLGSSREEAEGIFAEGRELGERSGDDTMLVLLLSTYAGMLGITGDMARGLGIGLDARARARAAGNAWLQMAVMPTTVYGLLVAGRYAESLAECERAIELGNADPGLAAGTVVQSPYAWAFMMGGFLHVAMGDIALGREWLDQAVELSTEHGDQETAGWAHMHHALLAYWSGQSEGAPEHVARSLELAEAIGSPFSRIWARYNVGVVLHETGDYEAAAAEIAATIELIHEARTGLECEVWCLAVLGRITGDAGEPERAAALLADALELAGKRGVRNVSPYAHTGLARALRAVGDLDAAEATADRALSDAREFGAVCDEGLALVEAAEIALDRGDTEPAEDHLRDARRLFAAAGANGHLADVESRLGVA